MTNVIINILFALLSFGMFVLFQSFMINGVYYCFQGACIQDMNKGKICKGNIFYRISPTFFEKHKGKLWTQNLWGCVRCMASVYGTLSYWPCALFCFGFHGWEIFVWLMDVFILTSLNYFVYKNL